MMSISRTAVLKIDIDTESAMKDCVPRMLDELERRELKASFCIPTAADRSGLALTRIFKQRGFVGKMIRNRAWRVFHPRTFVAGTLLKERCHLEHSELLQRIMDCGHEVGLHGYSHQVWQDGFDALDFDALEDQICMGLDAFRTTLRHEAPFFAAPAWKFNDSALKALCLHKVNTSSSCRGYKAGILKCGEKDVIELPTIPATLDEILPYGRFDAEREVSKILLHAPKSNLPVFGLHAEFEGGPYIVFFRALLDRLENSDYRIVTLSQAARLIENNEPCQLILGSKNIPGRTYPVAWVEEAVE